MSNDGMQVEKEPWFVRIADVIATRRFRIVLWSLLIAIVGQIPAAIVLENWEISRERNRLLNETDHHALLRACRDLMRDHPGISIANPQFDTRMPEIIRTLDPSWVQVEKDEVRIELHSGLHQHGIVAHSEGNAREEDWPKLLDGLWYYSRTRS